MSDSLRRVLWFVPLFLIGVLVWFVALAKTVAPPAGQLPLLWNAAPDSAEIAASRELRGFLAGTPDSAKKLSSLGGAGLPYLLAQLPALPVRDQLRLAEALWPLAARMGLDESDTFFGNAGDVAPDAETKLRVFRTLQDEHAMDFHPLAVQRLVRRVAEADFRPRLADLRIVDTYALPALIGELGPVKKAEDVTRVARIGTLIGAMTGEDFTLPPKPTMDDAQGLATHIRRYWDENSGRFSQHSPLVVLVGHVSQTAFASWARQAWRGLSGEDQSEVGRRGAPALRQSAPLFGMFVFGALALGPLGAGLARAFDFRRKRYLRGRLPPTRIVLAVLVVFWVPYLLLHLAPTPWVVLPSALLAGAMTSGFILDRELAGRADWRTASVLKGRSFFAQMATVARWLGPSLPTMAPLLVAETFVWLTAIELSTGVTGVGALTVQATVQGDLEWLLAVSLILSALTGLLQLISDAVLGPNPILSREP